jgi:hypothetical protein
VSTGTVVVICVVCSVASFVVGFFAGDSVGTKDTERRWTESVARAADARDRADTIAGNALDEIRRLTSAHADCQRNRIGDAENAGRLLGIISKLKSGTCWCGIGIGNPMVTGSHSEACKAAAEAVGVRL